MSGWVGGSAKIPGMPEYPPPPHHSVIPCPHPPTHTFGHFLYNVLAFLCPPPPPL